MPPSQGRGRSFCRRQLDVIKGLVGTGDYYYSGKVREFIADGWYGTVDLEWCILTAESIHKVEDEELGIAMDGHKYTILGRDTQGYVFYTCGKIILNQQDQRRYFFITAHETD